MAAVEARHVPPTPAAASGRLWPLGATVAGALADPVDAIVAFPKAAGSPQSGIE
jgi:hypothetical protein